MSTLTSIPQKSYTLIVRITERCNVGCNHCSIDAKPKGNDLQSDLLHSVLNRADRAGVGLIHFSGGEPLLHPELEPFIKTAADAGYYVEITTSTFTSGEDVSQRVAKLQEQGLQRFMVSYDAAHAKRVSIESYARFIVAAQRHNLELCACIVDWPGSDWPLERVKAECEALGVDGSTVDWCRVQLSLVGRAAANLGELKEQVANGSCTRCPFVFTAPTLIPDGTVYLCPNVNSRSQLFQIGNVNQDPIDTVLKRTENSPLYRSLAWHGPQTLAAKLEIASSEVATDMCRSCQAVLEAAESPVIRERIEALAPPEGQLIPLEVEALLPGHRRFVLGEKRPEYGCVCG